MKKKIILIVPSNHPTYKFIHNGLLKNLNNSFEILKFTSDELIDIEKDIYKRIKPYFVFSINRNRSIYLSKSIPHISWLMDNIFKNKEIKISHDLTNQRDIFFAINNNLKRNLKVNKMHILHPPANVIKKEMQLKKTKSSIISLVGYIPSKNIFQSDLANNYLNFLEDHFFNIDYYPLENINEIVDDFFSDQSLILKMKYMYKKKFDKSNAVINYLSINGFFKDEAIRAFLRAKAARKALETHFKTEIYGPECWKTWPEFKKYYRCELKSHSSCVSLYRRSLFNIHNGGTIIHPRVIDIMGSNGGILITSKMPHEDDSPFVIGEHYFDFSNPLELSDLSINKINKIRKQALDIVLENFSWKIFINKILSSIR